MKVSSLAKKVCLAAASAAMVGVASQAHAIAIIDNGTIQMGVNDEGHLNVPMTSPDPLGIGLMGLRYMPTGAASTEPGVPAEGWGISNGVVSGGANRWANGGGFNLSNVNFSSTASTAVSTVDAAGIFRVTHDYHPSASPNLYEVSVTIENISNSAQQMLYRRVMDWDIYPTPFSEFVTIINTSPKVYRTDTNGFNSSDPLSFSSFAPGPMPSNGFTPVIDSGPADHGALFDFDFGMINPGDTFSFITYYGAGATEKEVLDALALVQAENVYSLGQPNVAGGPDIGNPNTFVFGFKGVGGTPVGNPVPEPVTSALSVMGLGALAASLRRRTA